MVRRKKQTSLFDVLDKMIISWMQEHGLQWLRYSLAIVFIWFGLLKTFGLSPANGLVMNLVGSWVDSSWFIPFLGWWEVLIGVCLLWKPLVRLGIALMALQMIGTFSPLIFLEEVVYNPNFPFLTLEGQYIIKNVVLIAAALVIGSHVND